MENFTLLFECGKEFFKYICKISVATYINSVKNVPDSRLLPLSSRKCWNIKNFCLIWWIEELLSGMWFRELTKLKFLSLCTPFWELRFLHHPEVFLLAVIFDECILVNRTPIINIPIEICRDLFTTFFAWTYHSINFFKSPVIEFLRNLHEYENMSCLRHIFEMLFICNFCRIFSTILFTAVGITAGLLMALLYGLVVLTLWSDCKFHLIYYCYNDI